MASGSDPRRNLKQGIEHVLWKIHELEATLTDFQGNHTLLHERLNQYIEELGKLQSLREGLAVEVPVELLQHIDEGGNPDTFTSEVFKHTLRGNQLSKGKVEAFRTFRSCLQTPPVSAYAKLQQRTDTLLAEAAAAYPTEAVAYKQQVHPDAQQKPA